MLTDVPGVTVGHWTDRTAQTGCTVVLFPPDTVASAEVRGGAPASRELALLAPECTVAHIDATVLTGGSAFGLAAADGVMRFCEASGRGFPTSAGPVPIVPALALFDLAVGDARVRPGQSEGYAAAAAATDGPCELGLMGAGTGAYASHHRGGEGRVPAGLVAATLRAGDIVVSALCAVNAFGDIDRDGSAMRTLAAAMEDGAPLGSTQAFTNTTIGVVATNARLDKGRCLVVAKGAHDGLARAVAPAHTRYDGDAFIAAATGDADADLDVVHALAVAVVEQAVRSVAGS